jgi:hypothetical protein
MEWLNSFSDKEQAAIIAAIISAVVSIITVFLKGGIDWIREDRHLRYKLKKEYTFKQKMQIKESLAKSKTPLIKAAEDLNYRLNDFIDHIDEGWHSNTNEEIQTKNYGYYLKSFVYRLLSFFYWIEKAENDIYNFDFSVADKSDQVYLKYVKTMENFFCEKHLIKELIDNDPNNSKHHFYKNVINIYVSYMQKDGKLLSFDQFSSKEEYDPILSVFHYIREIRNDKNDPKYNIIMSFHLFLMLFLNKYGLDYQYTDRNKYHDIVTSYKDKIVIKNELEEFFEQNKILDEVKWIREELGLKTK